MLGAHGHSEWLDLSDYVVHFTKRMDFGAILSILGNQVLLRGPSAFGAAKNYPTLLESQRAVCFSEVPLGFLGRLAERRGSPYGIGFHKRFILANGGAPLWYVEFGSPQYHAVQALMQSAVLQGGPNAIWSITPFIDFPSGPTAPYNYDFRWEREWRTTADVRFRVEDVAFLLLAESDHQGAFDFFKQAVAENTGPGYFCPYVDSTWTVERVKLAMGAKP